VIEGLLEEVDEALFELFDALENRLDAFLKESGLATVNGKTKSTSE
jgi:hypothetical protein